MQCLKTRLNTFVLENNDDAFLNRVCAVCGVKCIFCQTELFLFCKTIQSAEYMDL